VRNITARTGFVCLFSSCIDLYAGVVTLATMNGTNLKERKLMVNKLPLMASMRGTCGRYERTESSCEAETSGRH
jgi:hypothetical protein